MGGSKTLTRISLLPACTLPVRSKVKGVYPPSCSPQAPAVDPYFGEVVDGAEMNQFPAGWLRRRQGDGDAIPAHSRIVAKVVKLSIPGKAGLGRTPLCLAIDGEGSELCFGVGS